MSWKLFYAAKKLFSECPPAQVSPYSSVPPWRTRPPRPPICPPAPRGGSTWPAWHSRFATHPNINLLVTDIHIPCFVFFPPAPFIPYLYHIYAILVVIHFPFIFHKFRSNIPSGFFFPWLRSISKHSFKNNWDKIHSPTRGFSKWLIPKSPWLSIFSTHKNIQTYTKIHGLSIFLGWFGVPHAPWLDRNQPVASVSRMHFSTAMRTSGRLGR